MNDRKEGKTRHRPQPEETTPAGSQQPQEVEHDASVEVDEAARELQGGSLRTELEQLGEDIDALRLSAYRAGGPARHLQSELDGLNQQQRRAMDELDNFESESASEWETFRSQMDQTCQELQDRLDAVREHLAETHSDEA